MKKIAIFVDNLNVGGIQKSIVNLVSNIDKNKYQIDLFTYSDKVFFDMDNDIHVTKLKKSPYILKFLPFKIAYRLYKPLISDKEYDFAIDFDSYQFYTAVAALKVKSKRKAIWIHNNIKIKLREELKYRILYFFFKKKYDYFDAYCAVSPGALKSFKELKERKNKKFYVIPNYINTTEIKNKMNEACELKINKNIINIVTVAGLFYQKGIDIMLKEMKELTKFRNDFHLYIIGDGTEKETLIKLTKKLNLTDKVTFIGAVKNPFKYMRIMDLFYLSSRYEGQGMVLLEALSVGLDVLMPKHLEKYCPDIQGTKNIMEYLKKYKKNTNKKFNDLKEYNENIINQIEDLFMS